MEYIKLLLIVSLTATLVSCAAKDDTNTSTVENTSKILSKDHTSLEESLGEKIPRGNDEDARHSRVKRQYSYYYPRYPPPIIPIFALGGGGFGIGRPGFGGGFGGRGFGGGFGGFGGRGFGRGFGGRGFGGGFGGRGFGGGFGGRGFGGGFGGRGWG